MAGDVIRYKLPKQFEKYTGLLNNVYPTREGVVTIPAEAEKKAGRLLKEHYGAEKVEDKPAQKEEPKK